MSKNERGQRGKAAEKTVEDIFKRWNTTMSFAWHRMADARAAMGRVSAQPADYLYFSRGTGGWLEVKETKHDYRLTKDKVQQLPILKKFMHAGADAWILVHHTTLDRWRIVCAQDLQLGAPSWDLSTFETHATAEDALLSTGCF